MLINITNPRTHEMNIKPVSTIPEAITLVKSITAQLTPSQWQQSHLTGTVYDNGEAVAKINYDGTIQRTNNIKISQ